jgi:hypothetical protein
MFLEQFVRRCEHHLEQSKRKTLSYNDCATVVGEEDRFEFLSDIIPNRIPIQKKRKKSDVATAAGDAGTAATAATASAQTTTTTTSAQVIDADGDNNDDSDATAAQGAKKGKQTTLDSFTRPTQQL